MDSQSTIRLEFTLKLDDYLQFQRSIVRHQLRWLRPIAALLTICFLLPRFFHGTGLRILWRNIATGWHYLSCPV